MKFKNNLIWIVLVLMFVALVYHYFFSGSKAEAEVKISYTEFLTKLDKEEIKKVSINGVLIKLEDKNAKIFLTAYPVGDTSLIPTLKEKKVEILVAFPEQSSSGIGMLFVIGLALFLIFMLIKSAKGGDQASGSSGGVGGVFGFSKSKAKISGPKDSKISFADVAGADEAKEELEEVVEFLKNPGKFQKLGAKIPKGCLLVGAPGTGKTLLAKAVSGEAKVPFFSISGSDFVEMFVGIGAARVRDLFIQAKKQSPCIVFIDEIDAVGKKRGISLGGANDEREQTLNQLLVEMDGFSFNQGIIILAATNRADVLDPALLRPGRFDRQIDVPLPDIIGREKILQIYLAKLPLAEDVNVSIIARGTIGFSGAELANLTNEAALSAAKKDKQLIDMIEFEEARDKLMMGSARKSAKMGLEERTLTAYHEAGHALVAFKTAGSYPVHKVTIIPRGRALGVTSFMPEKDEYSRSYKQLKAQLVVLFGGRIAEELVFGKENITTGAAMDIRMATSLAKRMISEWGFSEKIGRVRYVDNDDGVYSRGSSEDTTKEIEEEVKNLILNAEKEARAILTDYADAHKYLSQALLDYETLSGFEADLVCQGKRVEDIRRDYKGEVDTKVKIDQTVPTVSID